MSNTTWVGRHIDCTGCCTSCCCAVDTDFDDNSEDYDGYSCFDDSCYSCCCDSVVGCGEHDLADADADVSVVDDDDDDVLSEMSPR